MPVMLERWNDDKMDALDAKVDSLDTKVNRLDVKVEALDGKVDAVNAELREQRQDMKAGFELVNERFERMHRLLVQFCTAAIATLIGLIATQL